MTRDTLFTMIREAVEERAAHPGQPTQWIDVNKGAGVRMYDFPTVIVVEINRWALEETA